MFSVSLSNLVSDKANDFQTITKDLQEELNYIWDHLPIDTVIATLLDPRTKFYSKIPKKEETEALRILKKV